MNKVTEENALTIRNEQSSELSQTSAQAEKQYEIQASIIIANKFPRDEDRSYEKLIKACKRTSFAEDAAYSFKRGGTNITGPSINLAREGARVWGNIQYGVSIIRDDEETRLIRGWAWDLETNTKVSAEDDFKKLIYRKEGGWKTPDERDLRELTNRRAAIVVRNCLLQLLPKDIIEDAMEECTKTVKIKSEQDPEGTRRKLTLAFSSLNITPEMLIEKLGHPLEAATSTELAELRTIYKSIADGNSTWQEYVEKTTEPQKGKMTVEDLKEGAVLASEIKFK